MSPTTILPAISTFLSPKEASVLSGPVAVVLGATGRLSGAVVAALEAEFPRVIRVGRSLTASLDISGVEVRDRQWWEPRRWIGALYDAGCSPGDVGAVVNLVAGREPSTADCEKVGVGSVRATMGLAGAVCELAADAPTTIHLGSASEYRPDRLRGYAAGKAAARSEARRLGFDVVLTVGVVPRPVGDPADARLRRVVAAVSSIASVDIGVSGPGDVAGAVAALGSPHSAYLWRGSRCCEVTLAAEARPLGKVLGVDTRASWYGPVLRTVLSLWPGLSRTRWHRVAGFARLSRANDSRRNHYLHSLPDEGLAQLPALRLRDGFRLMTTHADDDAARHWIIPERLTSSLDARVTK